MPMTFRFRSAWLPLLLAATWPHPAHGEGEPFPKKEVVFWAHYMPMIPHGNLHYHGQAGGNMDSWPFVSQSDNPVDEYEEDIRQALASGIDGFQMLRFAPDAAFQAADAVCAETGRKFFIAPLWSDVGPDRLTLTQNPVQTADMIEAFVRKYRGNPHVYCTEGRQVHFLWLDVYPPGNPRDPAAWDKVLADDRAMERVVQELDRRGVGKEILLLPVIGGLDRYLLGRRDMLRTGWTPEELDRATDDPWIGNRPWRGYAGWDREWYPPAARKLEERLRQRPGLIYLPGVAAGYDSSNRPGQAIHVPYRGFRNLLDNLDLWVREFGYKQVSQSTWNDCQETLLIPSSRNVWADNAVYRFFHGIAQDGKSPDDAPKVLVCYPQDCLYGDRFEVQILGLPARDRGLEVRAKVELLSNGEAPTLSGTVAAPAPNREALLSLAWDTSGALGRIDYVQPRVTIQCRDDASSPWRTAYANLLLAPARLRYNLVQFPVRYAADLARVSADGSLSLQVGASGPLDEARVRADARSPIRRLVLSDASLSLGAFRPDEEGGAPDGAWKDLYLKIEASDNAPLRLAVSDGWIHDLYRLHPRPSQAVTPVRGREALLNPAAPSPGARAYPLVARCDLTAGSTIAVGLPDHPEAGEIRTTVAQLLQGAVGRTAAVDGKRINFSVRLTTDGTDPLVDFPLPAGGSFRRVLPLWAGHEGVRVLHAEALLASGQVAYSPAVVVEPASAAAREAVPVRFVDTGGTFDSFVDGSRSDSRSPFSAENIVSGTIPKDRVPFYRLDFEEGAGSRLNDRGTAQQPGRAWIEYGSVQRDDHNDPEGNGHFQWLPEGRWGRSLFLGENAAIYFRSKSEPVGAESVSLWVKAGEAAASPDGTVWKRLRAGPFGLALGQRPSDAAVSFRKGAASVTFPARAALQPGWNHVVFVYGLADLRCYVNGGLAGRTGAVPVVLQRTHQVPGIGFEQPRKDGLGFTGEVDEVQYVGTGLDEPEVRNLQAGKSWR